MKSIHPQLPDGVGRRLRVVGQRPWEAAKPWEHRHLWIGVPTTVCAAGTGVSAFSHHPIVTGVLAVVVGSGLNTFLNPNDRQRWDCDAGNAYNLPPS